VRLRLTRNVEATVEVEVFAEGEEPGMEPVEQTPVTPEELAGEAADVGIEEETGGEEPEPVKEEEA